MILTPDTPIYLPLVFPDSILAAAHRLADDVERVLGARPPLRKQPAPFGEPAVLLAPDPAYTAAVAPTAAETFVALVVGPELTITGADPLGTVLGLAWLTRTALGLTAVAAWHEQAPARRAAAPVEGSFTLPPWAEAERTWVVASADLPDEDACWRIGEAVLRAGGNTVGLAGDQPASLADALATLGVRLRPAVGEPLTDLAAPPEWW